MLDELLKNLKSYINAKKSDKGSLDSEFFIGIGFTETELDDKELERLGIGADFFSCWKRNIGNSEVTVVFHAKGERRLSVPKADEIHVHLLTKDLTTSEVKTEEYVWSERFSPLAREEML